MEPEIIQVLLQDATFLKEWKQVSDILKIPVGDWMTMNSILNSGNATMYSVIQWMLETWKGRNGNEATLAKLIQILEAEKFQNAADLLKDYFKRAAASNQSVHIEISPSNNMASAGMQQRNLDVLERIDIGTFSEVFKVGCIFDKKQFALKRISVGKFLELTKTSGAADGFEFFRKLIREVLVMAQLPENPNIVQYQEAWFEGPLQQQFTEWLRRPELLPRSPIVINAPNRPMIITDVEKNTFMYIKMELMHTNLDHWLHRNPNKIGDLKTTKIITGQILHGLASIHNQKIVHRDLKPNNILINFRGTDIIVKIGDFGLSREMTEVDTSLTKQVGGRSFSSPEMHRGDEYDFKTDIFSVGLIVLVMLYRFKSHTKVERVLDDVRRGEHGIIDGIEKAHGEEFGRLRAMLDRKPENRPTAQEC